MGSNIGCVKVLLGVPPAAHLKQPAGQCPWAITALCVCVRACVCVCGLNAMSKAIRHKRDLTVFQEYFIYTGHAQLVMVYAGMTADCWHGLQVDSAQSPALEEGRGTERAASMGHPSPPERRAPKSSASPTTPTHRSPDNQKLPVPQQDYR